MWCEVQSVDGACIEANGQGFGAAAAAENNITESSSAVWAQDTNDRLGLLGKSSLSQTPRYLDVKPRSRSIKKFLIWALLQRSSVLKNIPVPRDWLRQLWSLLREWWVLNWIFPCFNNIEPFHDTHLTQRGTPSVIGSSLRWRGTDTVCYIYTATFTHL